MSGILWEEMVSQGMARSRSEVVRLVKQRAIRCEVHSFCFLADDSELELPGTTVVRVGKHMFRCVSRLSGTGAAFDQLRGRIEIPVTAPESADGCIHIKVADVAA